MAKRPKINTEAEQRLVDAIDTNNKMTVTITITESLTEDNIDDDDAEHPTISYSIPSRLAPYPVLDIQVTNGYEKKVKISHELDEATAKDAAILLELNADMIAKTIKAAMFGASAVVLLTKLDDYPNIQCQQLADALWKLFSSAPQTIENIGIPVIVVAGPLTEKLSLLADGDTISIHVGCRQQARQTSTTEEIAALQKKIKAKIESRTAPTRWMNKQEADTLGIDFAKELAYINKFLMNYRSWRYHNSPRT